MQFVVHPNRIGAFCIVLVWEFSEFSVDGTNFFYHLYTTCANLEHDSCSLGREERVYRNRGIVRGMLIIRSTFMPNLVALFWSENPRNFC